MKKYFKILLVVIILVNLSFVKFEKKELNIVIDAGHGGEDFGTKNNEVYEKTIVESISKKIQSLNSDNEITINLTRNEDYSLSLKERVDIINQVKPDLVLSLHTNYSDNKNANGLNFYVSNESLEFEKSNEYALKLKKSFEEKTKLTTKGIQNAPLFILKKSNSPTIEINLGYISNENDRSYIITDTGQTEIAQTILNFISSLKN